MTASAGAAERLAHIEDVRAPVFTMPSLLMQSARVPIVGQWSRWLLERGVVTPVELTNTWNSRSIHEPSLALMKAEASRYVMHEVAAGASRLRHAAPKAQN